MQVVYSEAEEIDRESTLPANYVPTLGLPQVEEGHRRTDLSFRKCLILLKNHSINKCSERTSLGNHPLPGWPKRMTL